MLTPDAPAPAPSLVETLSTPLPPSPPAPHRPAPARALPRPLPVRRGAPDGELVPTRAARPPRPPRPRARPRLRQLRDHHRPRPPLPGARPPSLPLGPRRAGPGADPAPARRVHPPRDAAPRPRDGSHGRGGLLRRHGPACIARARGLGRPLGGDADLSRARRGQTGGPSSRALVRSPAGQGAKTIGVGAQRPPRPRASEPL